MGDACLIILLVAASITIGVLIALPGDVRPEEKAVKPEPVSPLLRIQLRGALGESPSGLKSGSSSHAGTTTGVPKTSRRLVIDFNYYQPDSFLHPIHDLTKRNRE